MNSELPIIGTIGSHSSLQILKGAKDEGFKTLLIVKRPHSRFYHTYKFIDEFVEVDDFSELFELEEKLSERNIIMIPHGSFVAYSGGKSHTERKLKYFGNKEVLDWEEDRGKQLKLLVEAQIKIPETYELPEEVHRPVIIKSFGAKGGQGYVFAPDRETLLRGLGTIGNEKCIIQEYILGVPMYFHYFYSPLSNELEFFGCDRRYETNTDGMARLPRDAQAKMDVSPTYVVVGNIPLTVRESLLPEIYRMGEDVVRASKKLINRRGIFGPFCIETIVTDKQEFYAIEISCRIVAGTNLFMAGSPYADLRYSEPMSTGRRIAREIKQAIEQGKLSEVIS